MIIKQLNIQYPSIWTHQNDASELFELLVELNDVAVLDEAKKLQGLLSADYILPITDLASLYQDSSEEFLQTVLSDILTVPVIRETDHIFNAVRLFEFAEEDKIAVISENESFSGFIQQDEVRNKILDGLNLEAETGVLLIELNAVNFSLSQIVQLIEQEGLKVLGLTVNRPSEHEDQFQLSIKLNSPDTIRATSSLKRFGYQVFDFSSGRSLSEDMKSRVDELLHFLSI